MVMKTKSVFCEKCREYTTFKVKEQETVHKLKDTNVEFVEKVATCSSCGCEVYVDELNDANLENIYARYRKINNIISLEKIKQIPEMYNIGKRPLSLILGWGEQTFTRYFDGYIPSQMYSKILKNIYEDPYAFLTILEENKGQISKVAYEKSRKATECLLYRDSISIDAVANYILCQCNDITPLALQKALYYAQGFYFALFNAFLLKENCEAWAHGPVYRCVYNTYSNYKYDAIDTVVPVDTTLFTPNQKLILDCVVKYFCCYSGKVLEDFTRKETPWSKTRGNLPDIAASKKVIKKTLICEYFKNVKKKYNMLTPNDISAYAVDMFQSR